MIRRALWTGAMLSMSTFAATADGKVDFQRDIRPLLSANCFYCHGPDDEHREAKLRLDDETSAKKDAIVPGKPDESELVFRLSSHDPDELMPPPETGKTITHEQIQVIRQWIAQGAEYEKHWSFVAPVQTELPDSSKHPVDSFVLQKLEQEDLTASPEADRITLLRRVSLDLTGLPPTVMEVAAFLADTDTNAYSTVVERMLASPAHGEHWARMWLDAARYADSNGYEKDSPREAWFYRDWVINAFNKDLPYDRFIIEQVAGDLLPHPTQDQIVATGFLRNSMINEEGGADPEQFRMEAMFDRMDAIGKSVLGLTIQCAQCHSHKFDPITHRDYYAMFAFLNNSAEGSVNVFTDEQQIKRREITVMIDAVEDELRAKHPEWPARMEQWEADVFKAPTYQWETLALEPNDTAAGGQKFLPQSDGSYLAQGYSPAKTSPIFHAGSALGNITALRLEVMTDPNLPRGGPGRSFKGLFALTEFSLEARDLEQEESKFAKQKFASASADIAIAEYPIDPFFTEKEDKDKRVEGPIDFAIDGRNETAWGIDAGAGQSNVSHEAVFNLENPLAFKQGAALKITLSQQHGGYNNNDNHSRNIGRFRISVTSDPRPTADMIPKAVREILAIPREQRSESQTKTIFSHWRTTVPEFADTNTRVDTLHKEFPLGHTQYVLHELPAPRETRLLERGDFLNKKELVRPDVPAFMHPLPDGAPRNRLTFAKWLVAPESPTAARSIVNRVWQEYFGKGLVETSGDLGSQGTVPSHPELLDWLAVDFMKNGWSLKHLHRRIVSSATYRQSSAATPAMHVRDPANRLLARGPRFRLPAEAIRDSALVASGLLEDKVGGPSVHPPAPDVLFVPPASYGFKSWNEDKNQERYRRALYTFKFRTAQYPGQQVFDAPSNEVSCVRRPESNTPLQALTTLNEPLFNECAQALGRKAIAEGGASDLQRLDFAFRRCLSRGPAADETETLLSFLRKQKSRFDETTAWVAVARVLMNLDETLTKQ